MDFVSWLVPVLAGSLFSFEARFRRIICKYTSNQRELSADESIDGSTPVNSADTAEDHSEVFYLKTPPMRFVTEYEENSEYLLDSNDWLPAHRVVVVRPDSLFEALNENFKAFISGLDDLLVRFMATEKGQDLFRTSVNIDQRTRLRTNFAPYYPDEDCDGIDAFSASIPYFVEDKDGFPRKSKVRYFYSNGSERDTPLTEGTLCVLRLKYHGPKYERWSWYRNDWLLIGVHEVPEPTPQKEEKKE